MKNTSYVNGRSKILDVTILNLDATLLVVMTNDLQESDSSMSTNKALLNIKSFA